jgi:predicted AAA+ superfamily ATPase
MPSEIQRPVFSQFLARLREPRGFLQVLAGPRQVGKTTLVRQVLAALAQQSTGAVAQHSVSAATPS